jgi:hypothetical protein
MRGGLIFVIAVLLIVNCLIIYYIVKPPNIESSKEFFVDEIPKNYRSASFPATDQYCFPSGELNPAQSANAQQSLRDIAKDGFGGKKGMDAIKFFLTSQYDKSLINSNINETSERMSAWNNCFGIKILDSEKHIGSVIGGVFDSSDTPTYQDEPPPRPPVVVTPVADPVPVPPPVPAPAPPADPTPPQPTCGPSPTAVILYTGENYTGIATKVRGPGRWEANDNIRGVDQLRTTGYINDSAKSIRIEPGFKVTLYQHDIGNKLYSGTSEVLTASKPTLATLGGLSSLVIELNCGAVECPIKCTYEDMPKNTNIITPQCATGTVDSLGLRRCFYRTLDEAKAKCDNDPACEGITLHPGVGYEPRSISKSVAGSVGAAAVGRAWGAMQGTSTAIPGFKSWKKTCGPDPNCGGGGGSAPIPNDGGGSTPLPNCKYGQRIINTNLEYPQCPKGSPIDSSGHGRCEKKTFKEAKALCDADPKCDGIRRLGPRLLFRGFYEPRRSGPDLGVGKTSVHSEITIRLKGSCSDGTAGRHAALAQYAHPIIQDIGMDLEENLMQF